MTKLPELFLLLAPSRLLSPNLPGQLESMVSEKAIVIQRSCRSLRQQQLRDRQSPANSVGDALPVARLVKGNAGRIRGETLLFEG
ncbi:hypothetical protein ACH5RR_014419 [Cinchona calisaya]|uniref:Uncharacterized protein n=1 Tax=Cinchona calisaya TaxID=153742 RepID=A0ABD3A2U9_9GENT